MGLKVESGNFSNLPQDVRKSMDTKIVAPRNPTLVKGTYLLNF